MGKKYNIAIIIIDLGICIFTSLFFLFSIDKVNDIYLTQARNDITKLKKSFLENTVNNLIQEIDVEREIETKLYEKIIKKQELIIKSKENLPEDEYEEYLKQYFTNDKDVYFWNLLIWDKGTKKEIYDPQNIVNVNWDGDINNTNVTLSSYGVIDRGNHLIIYGISKEYIDELVKNKIAEKIRKSKFDEESYIWVNEVIDYNGGDNYAIRKVHPSLPKTEGSYLSTNTRDLKGNLPYKEELEGVSRYGEIFFTYYFPKMNSNEVSEKLTYAKLYKDYNWIIAMGIHLDDIQEYATLTEETDKKLTGNLIVMLTLMLSCILIVSISITLLINKLHLNHEKKITDKEINIDQLTNARSRRFGTKELESQFIRYLENGESPAIMLFDIDFFKQINDKYGHDKGDEVLKKVVDAVFQATRSSDIIIRWGGDEFVGIFPGLKRDNCSFVGEKILSYITSQGIKNDDELITVTLSIGISYFEKTDLEYMDVIKRADAALYEAKTSGRNCVRVR